MNELLISDFKAALARFEPGDEMRKKQSVADCHLAEFQERFPIKRLKALQFEEFRAPYKNRDDFCAWITTRTSDVVFGRLPWGPNRLGAAGHFHVGRVAENADSYEEYVHRPLIAFIESRGVERREEVRRAIGYPLMLKILALYYPESFINIVKVSSIEQACDTFGLLRRGSVVDQSFDIKNFCTSCFQDRDGIGSLSLIRVLDDFVGLHTWNSDAFCSYLLNEIGLGASACQRIDRQLRTFSNRLQESCHLPRQLIQMGDAGLVRELWRKYAKTAEEREAVEWYGKFLIRGNDKKAKEQSLPDLTDQLLISESPSDLAARLQANAVRRKFFRHYTILSSLLYIVDGKCIRLTRGDDPNMNDQLEWQRLGDSPLWKRTFLNCLSGSVEESAAMWAIYGKPSNEAVRLSFPREAIEEWLAHLYALGSLEVELDDRCGRKRVAISAGQFTVIFGDVLYGGSLSKKKADAGAYIYRGKRLPKKRFAMASHDLEHSAAMTGLIKSADWAYEDESRFIVRIKEDAVIPGVKDLDDIKYVYLPIPTQVLNQVEAMAGPCVPDKLIPVLKGLVEQAGMTATESVYHGNLKFK